MRGIQKQEGIRWGVLAAGSAVIIAAALWMTWPAKRAVAGVDQAKPQGTVNRTVPAVTPPAPGLHFSDPPIDRDFLRTGIFAEPLVPVASTTPEENRDLARALLAYQEEIDRAGATDAVIPLLSFLSVHPDSAWKPGLLINLGKIYRHTGHFSKALQTMQAAWDSTKHLTTDNGRAMGDAAAATLSYFQAYLGRKEALKPLLEEIRARPVRGTAAEWISESSLGLAEMMERPEISFKCGPFALSRILLHQDPHPSAAALKVLEDSHSTPKGLSLSAVESISAKAGMNYQMAFRGPGAAMITPAVAHWKVDHYAAIVEKTDGSYLVEDPTFGENIRISPATLDEESSGYFLVPPGRLPQGWRPVAPSEGNRVWGRGFTPTQDNQATPAKPCNSCPCSGCTTWYYHEMVVDVGLHDRPVSYTPPVGPAIFFDVYYSQRDAIQPQTFNYTNLGPRWTMTWLSYVIDNNNSTADLYGRGGGGETFPFDGGSNSSRSGPYSHSVLTRQVENRKTTGFTRQLQDGSQEIFGQALGNKFFMTAVVDPQGNKATITYDSQMRIAAITDAIGQVTTFFYELASDPLKITKVTDPFGRSATFAYNASGQLISITDVLGITSQYTYGPGDFVSTLQTPYGTTKFTFGDSTTDSSLGTERFLEITNTLGQKMRVEFNHNAPVAFSDPANTIPKGMSTTNLYLIYRNTFIWDFNQYQLATAGGKLDYSKAKIIHWLHNPAGATSRVAESMKEPLENRVWYDYPGQRTSIFEGTADTPLHIGRVLDDGTTQLQTFEYNTMGEVTKATDPAGRQTTYSFASNNIDLLSVANTTGGKNDVLATMTYNNQHQPLTVTGADGGITHYEYNQAGQVVKVTDALGNVTTYGYDGQGYLVTAQGPLPGAQYSFTHDNVGRIATATDPAGSTVSYSYDNADRPTGATFPDGTSTKFTYKLLDLETTTDRKGQVTTLAYDSERQPVQITDPLGQVVKMGYSPAGKPTSITDANGHTTTLTLDGQNRVTGKQFADGTAQSIVYESTISRPHSVTDAQNQATVTTYNVDNTVAKIAYTNAATPTAPVSFLYDQAYPRPLSMTDGIGTIQYTYYSVSATPSAGANRLQSITSPIAGAASGSDTVAYSYDLLGRVVGRSVNNAPESMVFDALGRPTSITNPLDAFTYSYADATDRVTGISSAHGPQVALSYFGPKGDELLQQMTYTGPGGVMLAQFGYQFDANDNVTQFSQSFLGQKLAKATGGAAGGTITAALIPAMTKPPAGEPSITSGFTQESFNDGTLLVVVIGSLAGMGWIIFLRGRWRWIMLLHPMLVMLLAFGCNQGGSGGVSSNPPIQQSAKPTAEVTKYIYDAANRFISAAVGTDVADSPSPQFVYGYDPASNPTTITANGKTTTPNYTDTNALIPGTYDANGSPTDLDGKQYRWDAANRVIVIINGSNESDFFYDGVSRLVRIVEKQNGSVVSDRAYFWCGMLRCLEHDNLQTGSPVSKQYFGQGVLIGGQGYYYVTDRLGSVRQLVDETGQVRAQYDYDPYGVRTKLSGDLDSDIGYAGYFHHDASGLDFAVYRAYDPQQGRWLNRDPIGEDGGVNLYGYVRANPISRLDPWGLADVNVVNPKDPYFPPTDAYNPSDRFTFVGHGNQNDPNNFYTVGDEGARMGLIAEQVPFQRMGDLIIAKWDRKKPLYDLACHGHSSGLDANLAQYIANKIGIDVTIYGADGEVTAWAHRYKRWEIFGGGYFGPPIVIPDPSWQPITKYPQ